MASAKYKYIYNWHKWFNYLYISNDQILQNGISSTSEIWTQIQFLQKSMKLQNCLAMSTKVH